jgi:hypothetical protein
MGLDFLMGLIRYPAEIRLEIQFQQKMNDTTSTVDGAYSASAYNRVPLAGQRSRAKESFQTTDRTSL